MGEGVRAAGRGVSARDAVGLEVHASNAEERLKISAETDPVQGGDVAAGQDVQARKTTAEPEVSASHSAGRTGAAGQGASAKAAGQDGRAQTEARGCKGTRQDKKRDRGLRFGVWHAGGRRGGCRPGQQSRPGYSMEGTTWADGAWKGQGWPSTDAWPPTDQWPPLDTRQVQQKDSEIHGSRLAAVFAAAIDADRRDSNARVEELASRVGALETALMEKEAASKCCVEQLEKKLGVLELAQSVQQQQQLVEDVQTLELALEVGAQALATSELERLKLVKQVRELEEAAAAQQQRQLQQEARLSSEAEQALA
jgi:hypothetical protein